MKKTIYSFVIASIIGIGLNAQTTEDSNLENKRRLIDRELADIMDKTTTTTHTSGIEIGRPSKNCTGLGICIISSDTKTISKQSTDYSKSQIITTDKGKVILMIPNSKLPENYVKSDLFMKNQFSMEEDISIPKEVVLSVNPKSKSPDNVIIKKGIYGIKKEKGRIYIMNVTSIE